MEYFGKAFAVILAGGSGTRFWPKSRKLKPKQLCNISDPKRSMLALTLERIAEKIPIDRRLIVTHNEQLPLTKITTEALCQKFIPEPEAKNTLAALTAAALFIDKSKSEITNPIMVSLHADHVIKNKEAFLQTLQSALQIADTGKLTLIGIKPTKPETGFGYIEKAAPFSSGFLVKAFREKPDLKTATSYVASGNFLWNSGLFVWRVDTFLQEVKTHAPEVFETLNALSLDDLGRSSPALQKAYSKLNKMSVDEGILEKSSKIAVVEGTFDWEDIGSWDAMHVVKSPDDTGNITEGDTLLIDSSRNTVDTDGPLVALVGVTDMVVVVSQGAVMICPKNRSQDVKKIVEELQKRNRNDLL